MEATDVILSPFGPMKIVATPRGVSSIRLLGRRSVRSLRSSAPSCSRARCHLDRLRRQLCAYFEGMPIRFDVPLDLSSGTLFQRRVWRACALIPRGQVRSYRQVAAMAGRPSAARAVGQALGANPIPIVIPCHRVIRSDGSLCGYGLGARLKKHLLRLEGAL